MIKRLSHQPILTGIGILMTAIVLLAMVSMFSSAFIAETTEGLATAINQSGSLRMQSYRVGVALADESVPAAVRAVNTAALAQEFEARLDSPRLVDAIDGQTDNEVTRTYERITQLWQQSMAPPLSAHIQLLADDAARGTQALPHADYLAGVDAFVAEIDKLVRLLEDVAERRIDILRTIQAVSLALTVVIVVVTMALVLRRVIHPLGELLSCADRARRGDFSGHTEFAGNDELGRLGAAMNLMAENLSQMYGELEELVAKKTRDLERTNHSLELLYRTSKTLSEEPVSERLLQRVLLDIQNELKTGAGTLCLRQDETMPRGTLLVTTRPRSEQITPCWDQGCRACMDLEQSQQFSIDLSKDDSRQVMSFPVRDREQHFGVLLIDLPDDRHLESWQQRLLRALAGHIGTALNLQQRMRESRRLVLHEERSIIARELHDSLAQSLSYLKIQATRLGAALNDAQDPQAPNRVLVELREGINSAYRQLRELLTTFRLKMDDRGLKRALEGTVQEFRDRSAVNISLDDGLHASLLTPNEEIHVLQIVREALSNVIRHANARNAQVNLSRREGRVEVEIKDDGRGIGTSSQRIRHHGMTIMRERTLSLDGDISTESSPGGGTRICLRFRHRSAGTENPSGPLMLGTTH